MLEFGHHSTGFSQMAAYSTSPLRPPKPRMPAWMLSIMLHVATIVALCAVIQPVQHGVADAQYGSMGLVLHRTSNAGPAGPLIEPYHPIIQQTAAIMEVPAPTLLL